MVEATLEHLEIHDDHLDPKELLRSNVVLGARNCRTDLLVHKLAQLRHDHCLERPKVQLVVLVCEIAE